MKRSRWIIVPVLVAATVIGTLYLTGPVPQRAKGSDLKTAVSKKRRAYTYELKEIDRFQYPGTAVKEWMVFGGELFLLDEESQQVGIYDYEGQQIKTLGHPGDAPWENRQTQHLYVDAQGYATVDNSHMVIKKYSHEDELLFYNKLEEPIWDGVYLGGHRFFVLDDDAGDPGFYTVNARSGTTGPKQAITRMIGERPESEYLNIVYEGQVLRNDSKVVYMCSRTGKFFVFDRDGDYQYTGRTIDNTPPPSVNARKSGNITYYVREPDINVNYSGTVDNRYLYILSLISWEQTSTLSIDAYRLEDGTYAFSIKVPNAGSDLPVEVLRGDQHLFVLYEGQQIIRYEMVARDS